MKYSIITICYNDCDGLRRTIDSVLNQTCKDFEFIVIDGGSTDGSADIIKAHAAQIDYWVSERDKGIYNAMNKGIRQAHGEYLSFMNSGDCFHNERVLEDLLPSLGPDIVMGCTQMGVAVLKPHTPVTLYSLCIHGVSHQATIYRRSLFEQEQYDENIRLSADWKFTIKHLIVNNCSYATTDVVVADFDTTGISYQNPERVHEERRAILRQLLPERMADDYVFLSSIRSPLLDLLPALSKRYRLHRFIVWLDRLIMRMGGIK